MSHGLKNSLKTIAFVLCIFWNSPGLRAQNCQAGWTHRKFADTGANLTAGKAGPITAIVNCYTRYAQTSIFDSAEAAIQERFLREYADACLKAGDNLTRGQAAYFKKAIDISDQYYDWYSALPLGDQEKVGSTFFSRVVDSEITAYLKLGKRDDALFFLEELASNYAKEFEPRILNKWFEILRSYPDYTVNYSDQQIHGLIRTNADVRERWQKFRISVRMFASTPSMRNAANVLLPRVNSLLRM